MTTGAPTPPRSRRERPAKPALSLAGIVASALQVMREEGLPRVTMRRLAQELDTGPASLYVYVANTAELHAAILDELLGELDLAADAAPGPWQDRLTGLLTRYTVLLFGHPGLAQSALVARPAGPHYLALVEAVLALLAEGGVPDERAAWGVDLLLQVATATAAEQSARDADPGSAQDLRAHVAALRGADPATHPRITALADRLFAGSPEQRLGWAFRAVIAGVAADA
ncbi:TetR/AcrR family transcriptional regulator C-terminal domain-containing protein [Kitasatospora viridis]|uniref:TetR family transcriptional regulator n=1 Tax=Kitasatospora viridis TaxID=281105 RepID=A0A561T780_9ACTN|nr:TetR/AcrR family transcriptional regulator C-terminal domain-containing protein [Kitasatospora viridis]TWF82960.1 TetR family transcriptional regulator [Kitasatospora viridis]